MLLFEVLLNGYVSEKSPPASLEAQRSQRNLDFSIAVERTAKEKHSTLVHSQKSYRELLFTVAIDSPVRVADFCFPPSQRKAKK